MARYRVGMGKLFRKRKNGKVYGPWKFKYFGRDVSCETKDKAVAERFQRDYLKRPFDAPPQDSPVKISELLQLVVKDYKRKKLRTLDRLESRIERIEGLIGDRLARDFRAADVAAYIDTREDDDIAPATMNRELETLRRAFKIAEEDELIERAPRVRLLPVENVREVDISPREWKALLNELREPVRLMAIVAYYTGWRAGRIKRLKWSQVDFDAGVIRPDARQAANKWVGKAPVYGELRRALLIAHAEHEKNWPAVDWVLHREARRLLTYRAEWNRARKKIGRQDLHLHDLRHAAVTNMLDAGIDESRAMKVVGHKTFAMIKRYRIVAERHIAEAGRKLEAWHEQQDAKMKEQQRAEPDRPIN